MRQKLQEPDHSVSFIARTNRSPAALMCGLNARVMSLLYANGVTEEGAVVRAPDDGGALLVYVLPFYIASIMALVVVGWIRESYDDDAT